MSDERDRVSPPSSVTPEEASRQIRFALSELTTENAHHEFEHLSRHLTRRKICPNIIPATGPVSGGGDQGADFETYKTAPSASIASSSTRFFAQATSEKWIFACSLEKNYKKKIREDLSAAKGLCEPVDRLVFFHHHPIKTSDRHLLKNEARDNYGMELEIFDGKAIAEMLADRETVWIAERFLSLPSEFILASESPSASWFEEITQRSYDPEHLTSADFFEIRDAIRYATWHPEHHSDLAKLLVSLNLFREHRFRGISRRAIYEAFVASLRGLETTIGLENSLRQYFVDIETLEDAAEVEDAAILVSYALGAKSRQLLDIPKSELRDWYGRVVQRVRALLSADTTAGKQCAYLFVQGYLCLSGWMAETLDTHEERVFAHKKAAEGAVGSWLQVTKKAAEAPLFPVERLAKLINEIIPLLVGVQYLDKLNRSIDKLAMKRSGQQKVAEHHIERGTSFMRAKQYLRALDEFHRAHASSFFSGTSFKAVLLCIQLAKLYAQVSLHFAAKYYALAAVYASLRLPDERLREYAYIGCAEAASADYASGGSLLFLLTAYLFVLVTAEYSMGGSEERKQQEWARIEYYCLIIARASGLVYERLQQFMMQTMLPLLGLKEIYLKAQNQLDSFFSQIQTLDALAGKAKSENVAPALSDVGGRRYAAWRQLGINWHLEWETRYEVDRQAHALAAYLQILLADFADTELSILPGDVFVRVEVHGSDKLQIEQVPDNERVSRVVRLPQRTEDASALSTLALGVAGTLLKTVSALPPETFMERYDRQLAGGLKNRLGVYSPSEVLFNEFYNLELYEQIYGIAKSSLFTLPEYVIETPAELNGPQDTHPEYDNSESLVRVRNRYEIIPSLIPKTLSRLVTDSNFQGTLKELRTEGWKDWHLLTAIDNLRFNYVALRVPTYGTTLNTGDKKAFMELRMRPETDDDPIVPVQEFSAENLRMSLRMSQLSTLKGLGLEVFQPTPNFPGVDQLLRRFHYWDDDISHDSIF